MKHSKIRNLSYRLVSIVSFLLVLCLTHNQVNAQELNLSKGPGAITNVTMSRDIQSVHISNEDFNDIANVPISNSIVSLSTDCKGVSIVSNEKLITKKSLTSYEMPQIQKKNTKSVASKAVNVSGIIDASTLEDNAELVLTGNTNLFMDVNKTLRCIRGDYTLTLSGGNILTLNNPDDYAINVLSITISAPLIVKSSNVAISAKNDITINNTVNATSTNTCIGTVNGTISINADVTVTTNSSAAILNRGLDNGGDIIISNGVIKATGGNSGTWAYGIAARGSITSQAGTIINATGGTGIYAEDGNIHLAGNVVSVAKSKTGYGVYAEAGEVSLSTISVPSSYVGISANNGLTLNGDVEVNSADTGIGTVNGTLIINADVTVTTNSSAAILNRGINGGGDIIINKGTITATGGNSGTWAYGIAAGGNINIKSGKVVAKGGSKGILAQNGTISITPPLIVITAAGGGISADGHTVVYDNGKVATRVVIMDPPIAGVVALNSTPAPGNSVGFTVSGDFATSEISNVWQISDDNVTWQDIVENASAMTATIQGEYKQQRVATDITYTPKESEIGKYIRVKVSASDYSGYIYSPSRQIAKLLCTNAPAEPVLTNINDKVNLSNAKTTQEYIIFNYPKEASSLTPSDWNNAITPDSEVGFIELNSTANANHTVFTRIKETTSTLASENVAEARLYIGTSVYLTDIDLNITKTVGYFQKINNELNCKVGDVIRCDALPVPSDATNWYGISGSNWTVDYRNTGSPYGTFYEDADCTRPISSSSNYTTVYLKTLATKNYLDVRIQAYNSAIGYKTRYVQFNVTPDGYFPLLDYITNCSMTIAVGEKITGIEVGRRPFSGSVYGLTTEVSGEGSAPIVRFDMYEKMNIDATNATPGVYTYTPIQDGNPLTSTFTITVTDGKYGVDSVLIREKYIVADPGERVELVAQLMPANSEAEIQWTSSNTSVATVTDGIVTIADNAAIGAAATITASANGKSDECKITVSGEEYGLYVASTQVTSRNRDDILGDGKFCFDGLRTLTINGDYTVSNSSNFVRNTGIDDLNIEVAQACTISQDSESYSTLFDIRKNTILRGEQLTVNGNGVAFGTQGSITLTLDSANLIVSAIMPFKGSNLSSDSLSIINSRVEVHASGSAAVFNFEGGISLTDCYIQTPAGGEVVDAAIEDGNGNHVRDMVIVPLLMLYDDSDNTAVLETYVASGKTTHVQLVNRTFYKDNSWRTLCLPFDVTDLTGTPLDGATVMELNTSSRNGFDASSGILYLSFKTVSAIESGKSYIVKWTDGEDVANPVFEDVTILNNEPIAHTSETFDLETVAMVGTYAPFDIEANEQSIMLMGTGDNLFCPAEDTTLNGFHAYFEIPSLQGIEDTAIKGYVIDFDGLVVGINDITADNLQYPDGWHTITGIKLPKQPTTPGFYIHNGKKVFIK